MHRLTNLVILMMFSTKPLLPLYIKDSNPISKISLSSVHRNELRLISQYEGVLSTVILTDEVGRNVLIIVITTVTIGI